MKILEKFKSEVVGTGSAVMYVRERGEDVGQRSVPWRAFRSRLTGELFVRAYPDGYGGKSVKIRIDSLPWRLRKSLEREGLL